MLKCLSSVIIVFLILFTAGCQTNTVSNMFIPSNPSGMTLAQSVKDSLMESNDPVINQIHVESNQNVVILSGYVKKIRQSDIAEQIARQVQGVQLVENRIIVRP
ncbi:periplasmic protein [Legionella pneumophila]|uniref:BON domain-containing protein n=1 Tax=Legionella pneumophila TaxID=446 RepID=UPI0005C43221|nr:BON domain-containing protein [Legionella pneumophila]GAN18209.1 periplasmic protein [Legionella pneumophila]GAN21315.1 periplasmic protein [Legionella pneumophila]